MSRSSGAWDDGTQMLSSVTPAAGSRANVQDPTLFHGPSNEANKLLKIKTMRKRMSQILAYEKTVLLFVGALFIKHCVFFFLKKILACGH